MKKVLTIMLAAALAMPMFAEKQTPEERANADYSSWTPKAGDYCIGFSLDPFADFVGQMFNTAGSGSYDGKLGGKALVNPIVSISGEYMLTDQLGVRANIGFIVDYERTLTNVDDAAAKWENPYSRAQVQDAQRAGQYGGSFSAGVDYRIATYRVYLAQVWYMLSKPSLTSTAMVIRLLRFFRLRRSLILLSILLLRATCRMLV